MAYDLSSVLEDISCKPYYLHLELTNLCNANCIFCGYQFQKRPVERMPDGIFRKAVRDFVAEGGGSVTLTPIVGDALVDDQFLARVRLLRAESRIDRIRLITNGILLDRFGIDNIVNSGLDFLAVSVPGFDAETYERVFRSKSYTRVRDNLIAVLKANERSRSIRKISILIRSDRPIEELAESRDYLALIKYRPEIHYTSVFSSCIERIAPAALPKGMSLVPQPLNARQEPCSKTFDSPIVLPDGTILICDCFSAMDAVADLAIGNILERPLGEIWRGERTRRLRESFLRKELNLTCGQCDNYQDLGMYRSEEGSIRSRLNRLRRAGGWEQRQPTEDGYWMNP